MRIIKKIVIFIVLFYISLFVFFLGSKSSAPWCFEDEVELDMDDEEYLKDKSYFTATYEVKSAEEYPKDEKASDKEWPKKCRFNIFGEFYNSDFKYSKIYKNKNVPSADTTSLYEEDFVLTDTVLNNKMF